MEHIHAMQDQAAGKGMLQINVTSAADSRPVQGALVSISYTGVPEQTLEQIVTDSSGQSEVLTLDAPPAEWSLDPENERQPYSEYTLDISAPGFEPVSIAGTEILADVKALQNVRMQPDGTGGEEEEVFVIPAHTLYASYPPKISEAEIKPVNESGEIVLSRVVVPEYIIVHGLHQKCSVKRDLCNLAGGYDTGECAGDHVLYSESGVYGMVPQQGV